jgi:hypothetical protein
MRDIPSGSVGPLAQPVHSRYCTLNRIQSISSLQVTSGLYGLMAARARLFDSLRPFLAAHAATAKSSGWKTRDFPVEAIVPS